ncbi:hypothetical protein LMG18096_02639 [Ralstonia holmesii]|uniref:Transmembrane protein n=2 Tax=Burkholderiaceae TaxID=119060 RepID=A0ABC8QCG9_9RALS|nr:hypothetical protein LMG18096_02639 [Ralstonia sp. LMG 32967]CAJ0816394.1 hypothetical protein LMG18093_03002 [Ralstonia sp. LMG 32967]
MQNSPLHSQRTPPNHSPVTRLIAALKAADITEDDKLSRRQTLSAALGFLLALLGLGLFALYERHSNEAWLVWASMAALGGGTAWSVVFTVFGGREILHMLKRFEIDALTGAEPRIAERYRLAQRIGAEFDANQIEFAKAYLQAGCQDVRSRIGMGVGALEKIGLLPLVASTLVALAKMYESSQFATFWCAGALVLLLFYLGAMKILGATQTIDRLVLVLSHAETYAAERSGRQPVNSQC